MKERQAHGERRAVMRLARDGNLSVMLIDDPFHETESQADAVDAGGPRRIGAKESIEDMRQRIRGYAGAAVLYRQLRHVVLGDFHSYVSIGRREFDRVVKEIEQQS